MKRGKATKIGLVTFFSTLTIGTFMIQNSTQIEAAPLGTPLTNSAFTSTPVPDKFLNIWNTKVMTWNLMQSLIPLSVTL